MGTVVYAAPECLHKPQEATARMDVFSIGMTAIFCLSGEELSLETFKDPEKTIADLNCSADVKSVLTQAVAWKPDDRFADAQAMGTALRAALNGTYVRPARKRPPVRHVILFLAANPRGTDRLALDEEARSIQTELDRSGYRDHFDLRMLWAAQPSDLWQGLRKFKPTVVHFSGHGGEDGLYFHNSSGGVQSMSVEALTQTFDAAGSSVRLLIIHAAYSDTHAEALRTHVDCVVGVRGALADEAARSFAIGLYGSLAEGESIAKAYRCGRDAINLEGLPSAANWVLKVRAGVDAEQLVLVTESPPASIARVERLLRPQQKQSLQTQSATSELQFQPIADSVVFAWIHLSDIHLGHGDGAHGSDQQLVLEVLRNDVGALVASGRVPQPSAILVTGDIAFSGASRRSNEYNDARAWLFAIADATNVPHTGVRVVAGNHDVERSADRDVAVATLIKSLRRGERTIDDVVNDGPSKALLFRRMHNYLQFAHDLPVAGMWWSEPRTLAEGLEVRLVGLNTALLAADDEDHGNLRLGKCQLKGLVARAPGARTIGIVLTHHPLRGGWLADEAEVAAWVRGHAHIHLCGHVHDAEAVQVVSGGGSGLITVTAGASHGDRGVSWRTASHGYNVAALLRGPNGKLRLGVWPRRWVPAEACFRVDVANVPDGSDHSMHEIQAERHKAELVVRRESIADLADEFARLHSMHDRRARGIQFEEFLRRLFALHDLEPHRAFSVTGEQADGSIRVDSQLFLVEARWREEPTSSDDIRSFRGKVEEKLDNTLGIIVSMSGFTSEAIKRAAVLPTKVILVDGQDLASVMQGVVDLVAMLRHKIRRAAEAGEVLSRFLM